MEEQSEDTRVDTFDTESGKEEKLNRQELQKE